jgi:MATE family multidrug resistance protein
LQASVSNKYIIRTAAPIALALLIPLINNLTNNFFLGRVGERALAVNGVAGIYYLILAMVGYGLANGVQVQLSRRAAQHDYAGITRLLTNSGMLTIFIALCLMIVSMWFAPLIFGYSLQVGEHVYMSVSFIFIRVWGLPFLMLTQLANSFYISTGRSQYMLWGSLAATVLNVVLDYTFIFGHYGAPAMGLNGAAIASVLAEIGGCAVMWGLFYLRKLHMQFPVLEHIDIDLRLVRRVTRIALPLVVQYFFSIAGWQVFFIFVEHLGERELAASQILRPIFGVIGVATWAFGTTCNMSVSNIIGQGRTTEVPRLIGKIMVLSISVSAVLCAGLLLLARPYLHMFTQDEALVALALPSLYIIACATLMMSVASVLFNGVIGTGNTSVNLIIEVICVGSYLVYCYFIIQRARLGLTWAWGSEFVYWTSLLICGFAYLRSGRWKGKVI